MNWIYLGIVLNIISTIYLTYLDYQDDIDFTISDLIFIFIITSIPFFTFSISIVDALKSSFSKYEIDLNKVLIKGKKK